MQSLYVIGGAGTGKSTFLFELMKRMGVKADPVSDIYIGPGGGKDSFRNRKVRGHQLTGNGLYLGVMREDFPGTDGLDKVILPVASRWISEALLQWDYLISEGLRLANTDFLVPLADRSDLLVIHLDVPDFIADLRFIQRGSAQPEQFIKASRTRAKKLADDLIDRGFDVRGAIDTSNTEGWNCALSIAEHHLKETLI